MANPFEKPLQYNPQSTFVGLPLELMANQVARRQQDYDRNKAALGGLEDQLLSIDVAQGDVQRRDELIAKYEDRINDYVSSSNGDYSGATGIVDQLVREVGRDVKFGELGKMANNKAAMGAYSTQLADDHREGKVSEAAYSLGMESLQGFQTTQGEDGRFSAFQGYQYTKPYELRETMTKIGKDIAEQHNSQGMKTKTSLRVIKALKSAYSNDPAMRRAFMEDFKAFGSVDKDLITKLVEEEGKTQEQAQQMAFALGLESYAGKQMSQIANEQAYEEVAKRTGGSVLQSAMTLKGVQNAFGSGQLSYKEGSMSFLKGATDSIIGIGLEGHNEFVESDEGKRLISRLEPQLGDFPSEYQDQVDWFENAGELNRTMDVTLVPLKSDPSRFVDDNGVLLNNRSAIRDGDTGQLLDADQIADLSKVNEDAPERKLSAHSRVQGGPYHGFLALTDGNGKFYYQEPSDPAILNSPTYTLNMLNRASKSSTGMTRGVIRNVEALNIPPGNYDITETVSDGEYSEYIVDNGQSKYKVVKQKGPAGPEYVTVKMKTND